MTRKLKRFYVVSMRNADDSRLSHWLVCDRKYIHPDKRFNSRTQAYAHAQAMNHEEFSYVS